MVDRGLGGTPVAGVAQCGEYGGDGVLPGLARLGLFQQSEGAGQVGCGGAGEDGDLAEAQ
ncbi:hypothetical protein ACIGXM_20945 [Kitasatospora sp. NPDC052896]|uniref:hypothetical protein n=1 Tax=Kitasatospora sp. NPDC052896 TaxID=3364061 RepID=UPI0037CAB336